MIGFVILYGLATALKFLLRPYILVPIVGVVTALWFNPTNSKHWHIIGVFVVIGLLMALYEHLVRKFRGRFLDKHMSVDYLIFPRESSGRDRLLYHATYLPSLLLITVLLYVAMRLIKLPFANPELASLIAGLVCVLLYARGKLIVRPSWSPNGPRPLPEKRFDIHEAAESGDIDKLREALDGGANPNLMTNKQMAPLHIAIEAGQVEAVRMLVERGADVKKTGSGFRSRTPLMFAAAAGNQEIIDILLQHGADMHVLDGEQRNVLFWCTTRPQIFRFFLDQDVDYKLIDQYGESLLSYAAGNTGDGWEPNPYVHETIQLLLDKGMPADGLDGERSVPLAQAAFVANLKVMEMLLQHKAKPDRVGKFGRSALFEGVQKGDIDMVRLMLQYGADANATMRDTDNGGDVTALQFLQAREGEYYDEEREQIDKEIIELLQQAQHD